MEGQQQQFGVSAAAAAGVPVVVAAAGMSMKDRRPLQRSKSDAY